MKKPSADRPNLASFDSRSPTISRRKAVEVSRTLLVVVPLTLLIWVYAERAQSTTEVVQTLLAFSVVQPGLAATPADPTDAPVSISLSGARGQIDQFKTKMERQSDDHHLRLVLPSADATVGEHNVDLARLLNDSTLMNDSGVTVIKTTPLMARVNVDPVLSRDAKVVLPRESPVTLESYKFTPATVNVRGPSPAFAGQFGLEEPTVVIDLSAVATALANGQGTIDVPLVPFRDSKLKAEVSSVKMTFQVGSAEQRYTIPSVAIQLQRPLSLEGRLKVDLRRGQLPVIPNVQIRGPVRLVSRYTGEAPPERLTAVLRIYPEDAGKTDLSRDVEFTNLKPGVTIEGGPYRVSFDVNSVADADR